MVFSKPLFFFLFLFLFLCHQPFHAMVVAQDVSSRKPFSTKKPILLNCGDLVLKSKCSQNSKCTWCTSQDLDDNCFSKSEALRLPHQVFSCGPTSS
ncbi:hypothetical protein QL285_071732 [Trifolium repens]|nr:hypothetical protein QL285_071732 [Trifolium repens]